MSQDDWNNGFIVGVIAGDAPLAAGGGSGSTTYIYGPKLVSLFKFVKINTKLVTLTLH